jgi:hypothetical protein
VAGHLRRLDWVDAAAPVSVLAPSEIATVCQPESSIGG